MHCGFALRTAPRAAVRKVAATAFRAWVWGGGVLGRKGIGSLATFSGEPIFSEWFVDEERENRRDRKLLWQSAIASVVATSLLFPGTLLDRLWELNKPAYAGIKVLGRASGVLLLLLGMATAAAGTGLLRGKKWACWLSIGVFVASGLEILSVG
jgi:hypothetical protein